MTKSELLSKMKEHQQAYAKYAAELKAISAAEEQKAYEERQLARLEEYKAKYRFFVNNDDTIKEIDWEEVEKLIKTSFNQNLGYSLGFDQNGMEGLGYGDSSGGQFIPMVEDEIEGQRFLARDKRRKEFAAKLKPK
jgi:hypothetical protein